MRIFLYYERLGRNISADRWNRTVRYTDRSYPTTVARCSGRRREFLAVICNRLKRTLQCTCLKNGNFPGDPSPPGGENATRRVVNGGKFRMDASPLAETRSDEMYVGHVQEWPNQSCGQHRSDVKSDKNFGDNEWPAEATTTVRQVPSTNRGKASSDVYVTTVFVRVRLTSAGPVIACNGRTFRLDVLSKWNTRTSSDCFFAIRTLSAQIRSQRSSPEHSGVYNSEYVSSSLDTIWIGRTRRTSVQFASWLVFVLTRFDRRLHRVHRFSRAFGQAVRAYRVDIVVGSLYVYWRKETNWIGLTFFLFYRVPSVVFETRLVRGLI